MDEENGDKTQDATPHRRQQAREQGQVVQSQDLAQAVILVVGISILLYWSSETANFFATYTRHQFDQAWLTADGAFISEHINGVLMELGHVVLPMLGLLVLAAVAAHMGQTGFLWLPEKLSFDWSRVSPLSGFGRLFSLSNVVRLGFGSIKILIVSLVAVWSLWGRHKDIVAASSLELPQLATFISDITLWTCLKIGIALLILSLLDYLFQRWKHEKDLRMTNQEVREEMKELQGDPQIIARRRAAQRQLVLNRLNSTVPKADVVVTNPTELAVAIQYDMDTMRAPIVIAKGAGVVAQRIRRLALENGVPIVERKPLAQLLYKEVDVKHPIPDRIYGAVAEVLAYVYQLKGKPIPGKRESA